MSAFPCAISYIICLIVLTQGITVQILGITIDIPLSRLIDSYHKRGILFVPKIGTGRPSAQYPFMCGGFFYARNSLTHKHSLTHERLQAKLDRYDSTTYPARSTPSRAIAITPSRTIPRRGFAVRNYLSSVSFIKLQTNIAVKITT